MVSCAFCGCSLTPQNKNSGVTFHRFPKDEKRRIQWIHFLKRPEYIPKRSSVLCSYHFAKDCFDRTSQVSVRLRTNAIPTIEVDRLKYVRTFNPVFTKPIELVEDQLTKIDVLSDDIDMCGPSTREETPPPALGKIEDSPSTKVLNRMISDLEKNNILKSHKIRKLQKINWRQKKEISSLKEKLLDLRKKT